MSNNDLVDKKLTNYNRIGKNNTSLLKSGEKMIKNNTKMSNNGIVHKELPIYNRWVFT